MRAERNGGPIVAEPRGRYAARPPIVVDCSVVAAVLFDEPERESAAAALAGRELHAPDLLAHEIASVAVKKSALGLRQVVEQGLADFAELELIRSAVDVREQTRLAIEHGLSAYDAAYLRLAVELGAPLVTFDTRLGDAARALLESG